jgi:hypothetical protein
MIVLLMAAEVVDTVLATSFWSKNFTKRLWPTWLLGPLINI